MVQQITPTVKTQKDDAQQWRELAQFYHGFGLNVVPLGADKVPVLIVGKTGSAYPLPWANWQNSRQTDTQFKEMRKPSWWVDVRGIGATCGKGSGGLVYVDFDSLRKHDPSQPPIPSDVVLRFLAALELPEAYSWHTATPTGGRGVWVLCPDLSIPKSKLDRPGTDPSVDHVELRFTGCMGVLPGSEHPSGGRYAWAGDEPAAPPATVDAKTLLAAYNAITEPEAPHKPTTPPTRPIKTSRNGNHAYAEAALTNEVAAVRSAGKGNRNNQIFESACNLGELVEAGALDRTRVETELTFAAQSMTEPLSDGDIAKTISSGFKKVAGKPRQIPESARHTNGTGAGHADGFRADAPDTLDLGGEDGEEQPHTSWPYNVKRGRMVYMFKTEKGELDSKPIADFEARITAQVRGEDGERHYIVEGRGLRGGQFTLDIAAADFHDARKLHAALGAAVGGLDVIYARMSGHLEPAIGALSSAEERRQITRYTRTGWAGDAFIMPGRAMAEGTEAQLPRKLPYSVTASADLPKGLDALSDLLLAVTPEVAAPVLSTIFQAPAHRKLGWQNERYGVFIQGRTGSLKTSWTQTAMCLFGPDFAQDDLLIKWGEGATRNAIMALAAGAHDMPFLIDNYKPNTGGGSTDFVNLLHNILEGGEKDRLTRASTLRPSKAVHCFPLITGEDVPDSDPASLARVLVVRFEWQRGQVNDALSRAQAASSHLCAVGGAWLDWLESDEAQPLLAEVGAQLPEYRKKWAAHLHTIRPDMVNILRVATNLATNELTWQLASLHPALGQICGKYAGAHRAGLLSIAGSMATATAESLEAKQFLNALRELLSTRQYILVDRGQDAPDYERDRVLGWKDSSGIYLLPQTALTAVNRLLAKNALLISPQVLWGQLDGLGLLAMKGGEGKSARVVKFAGKAQRVIHLRADALTEAEDEADQEEDALLSELGL